MYSKEEIVAVSLDEADRKQLADFQQKFKAVHQEFLQQPGDPDFFLATNAYEYLLQIFPKYFEKVKNKIDQGDSLEQWELRNISTILGKAVIPDSIRPTVENAKRLIQDIAEDVKDGKTSRIVIRELCTGAGLATLFTMLLAREQLKTPVTLIGTDYALESITISALLLSMFDIPHCIITGPLQESAMDFDGVVFHYMDVNHSLELEAGAKYKYDYIFSDHGISYFSPPLHERALDNIFDLIKPHGVIYISALEPKVKLKLNNPKMVMRILTNGGKLREKLVVERKKRMDEFLAGKRHGDTIENDIELLPDGKIRIVATNTADSAGVYDMLYTYLFKKGLSGLKDFSKYLKTIGSITRAARELGTEIQSPIESTVNYLQSKKPGAKLSLYPPFDQGRRITRSIRIAL